MRTMLKRAERGRRAGEVRWRMAGFSLFIEVEGAAGG
jgi:hypothetical protein